MSGLERVVFHDYLVGGTSKPPGRAGSVFVIGAIGRLPSLLTALVAAGVSWRVALRLYPFRLDAIAKNLIECGQGSILGGLGFPNG